MSRRDTSEHSPPSSTAAVHTPGARPGPGPIHQQALFTFPNLKELIAVFRREKPGHFYTRHGNPGFDRVESLLAEMEEAEAALVFSSGMAAIATVMLSLAVGGGRTKKKGGADIVALADLYGGTAAFLNDVAPACGLRVRTAPVDDLAALERAVRAGARLVYFETPTNPLNRIVDLAAVAHICRSAGALTVVDNTFATPLNQRPLRRGIDVVVHSATKYLGGHADLLAGCAAGPARLMRRVAAWRTMLGGTPNGFEAWLLERSLKTFPMRMRAHNANAFSVAWFLSVHPRVRRVYYPGLEADPGHQVARRQMAGFGGIVSFDLAGGFRETERFVNSLKLFHLAASLGGAESLVSLPAFTSHLWIPKAQREAMGIGENTVRLAVGLENDEDLVRDLDQALAAAFPAPAARRGRLALARPRTTPTGRRP
ncbi:MAG: aminotransferase class I/II-fold pyridoxal phosphate-dependent enzyme [Planctomycetes bacterium]|nr:aminotransferase class I/II-fold pyridoxal phosphate-dependent enzyme [Planctomycetota bacterium]